MEPMVGKTVSNKTVSVEKARTSKGLVSALSFFLQEKKPTEINPAMLQKIKNLEICMITILRASKLSNY